jgi:cbb3-type cytochrome oxidase subunit 1
VSFPGTIDPATGQTRLPSMTIPLRFVITGMLSLFVGTGLLVARPDLLATYHYNQYVIAVTHLFVLGFIGSIVMGAMYQLVPVALETRLHSERLARWHYVAHAIGFVGMVVTFWLWNMKQVGHYGSVLAVGVGLFVFNLVKTLRTVPRWNVIATAIASALFWFSMTVLAGLYLACSKCWNFSPFAAIPAMHAHAHLGGLGVFVMLIVGVSYKLIPMFVLGELQSRRRAGWSIGLLNAGLLGLFVTILLQSRLKLVFALVAITGLALYGLEIRAVLRRRTRRVLDWGIRSFLTAITMLVPLSGLALVLCWPGLPATALTTQLENAYGFLGLIGVVGFAILGMLYKIVPFLVWFHRYSGEIGRSRVPSMAEMYSERLQVAGYWTFLGGLGAASVFIALGHEAGVRWSCALLAASLGIFALNMGQVLRHLIAPRVLPTAPAGRANAAATANGMTLTRAVGPT